MFFRRHIASVVVLLLMGIVMGCNGGSNSSGGSLAAQLADALEILDPVDKTNEIIAIGKQYQDNDQKIKARECFKLAAEAASEINVKRQATSGVRAYLSLANAFHGATDKINCKKAYEEVEDALDEVKKPVERANILHDLAEVKINVDEKSDATDDLKSAEKTSAEIDDVIEKVQTLTWISYRYRQMENMSEAERVMTSAQDIADAQETVSDKIQVLVIVGTEKVLSLDKKAEGIETLNRAIELARTIKDSPNLRANRLIGIAEGFKKIDEKRTACDVLSEAEVLVRDLSEGKPAMRKIEENRIDIGCATLQ